MTAGAQHEEYLRTWLDAFRAAGWPDAETFIEHTDTRLSLTQQRRLAVAASNDHAKLVFSLHHPTARPTREFTRELMDRESREEAWVAVQRELPQALRRGWRAGTTSWEEQVDATSDPVTRSGALVLLDDGGFRGLNAYGYLTPLPDDAGSPGRALPRLRALAAARGLTVAGLGPDAGPASAAGAE